MTAKRRRDRMGLVNVGTVYARWAHLPDPAFRLLGYMAVISRDDDDPPLCWSGREMLARALGRITPEEPAATDLSARAEWSRKAREADFKAVSRALRPLVAAAVVTVFKNAAPGRPAVYSLDLMAPGGGSTGDAGRRSRGTFGDLDGGRLASPVVGGKGGGDFVENHNQGQSMLLPKSGTSLALVPEFENARKYLDSLGIAAGVFMERAHESRPDLDMRGIVIHAATMAQSERKTS